MALGDDLKKARREAQEFKEIIMLHIRFCN